MSLKIGVIYPVPFGSHCSLDPVCHRRGYYVEATMLACRWLSWNCTFLWYNETDYGDADENGAGSGMIGAIQNGIFDTSIPDYTPTSRRLGAVTFSQIYEANKIILMTRSSMDIEPGSNWNIASPFQRSVWICFLSSLILVSLVIGLVIRKKQNGFSTYTNLNTFFEVCTYLIVNEIKVSLLKLNFIRIVFGAWLLGCMVLLSAYTGVLFSQRISFKRKLPFIDTETFVQCLENGRCSIVTPWLPLSYLEELNSFGDILSARIRNSFQKNPIIFVNESEEETPNWISNEKVKYLVTIGPENILLSWISGNRDCSFYTMDMGYKEINSFPLAKNSPYVESLNRVALAFSELGIDRMLYKKYVNVSRCDDQSIRNNYQTTMLSSMVTTFYFYGLGICGGALAFLLEMLTKGFRA